VTGRGRSGGTPGSEIDRVVRLEYEIAKYERDFGQPDLFVPLESDVSRQKVSLPMRLFGSQRSKRWFTEALFTSVTQKPFARANSRSGPSGPQ
jgi:hypothetical protein